MDAAHSSRSGERPSSPIKTRAPTDKTVGWKDLPKKKQLAVIVLARLSEPLTQTSLNAYLFYQVKWFDPTQTAAEIAMKAGLLQSSFTGAQFLTAMAWGRLADSSSFGRKRVILCGLCGTFLSSVGYAFSTSFTMALAFRVLGGITNGNVGVLRTMISETIREKRFQSRAFLLLPMTFNIGVTIGPSIGGMLSDLAGSYPDVFGKVQLFVKFPYAAPNLFSACILLCGITFTWLCLEETLDSRLDKKDLGIEIGKRISSLFGSLSCLWKGKRAGYTKIASTSYDAGTDDSFHDDLLSSTAASSRPSLDEPGPLLAQAPTPVRRPRYTQRLPFRRIFTRNVIFTLMAHFLLAFHLGTFNSLWPVFLSTPAYDPSEPTPPGSLPRHLPFFFIGGIGFPSQQVGPAMSILGTIGIVLQLLVYPRLSAKLGTTRSLRTFLTCFPVVYFAVPFLSLIPSTTAADSHTKTGPWIWFAITAVIAVHVLGRTFALPAQTILINNCSPHPSVLGTVHGIGQTASSAARTLGPALGALVFGLGLEKGVVGAVWWMLSGVAVCGLVATCIWVREGNGHEIWLDGDNEDED